MTDEVQERFPQFSSEKPSEELYLAFCHSASIAIDCDMCGRTHFVSGNEADYDEGEYQKLLENKTTNPDKYIEHNDVDSIRWFRLGDDQIVFDCPCGFAAYFENIMINYRNSIIKYLKAKSDANLANAKDFAKKITELPEYDGQGTS